MERLDPLCRGAHMAINTHLPKFIVLVAPHGMRETLLADGDMRASSELEVQLLLLLAMPALSCFQEVVSDPWDI